MMHKKAMIDMAKKAFPVEITQGEELLDEAIFTISQRFVRCMDRDYPLPTTDELPEELWFQVIMAVTEMLLQGRKGRLYFTEKSFPFLRR